MKRVITILYTLAIVALASCTKSGDELTSAGIGSAVNFTVDSSVSSRSSQDQKDEFATGNQIGIFMESEDGTLLSENVVYTIVDGGVSGDAIYYPRSGEVDFYAYAPYTSSVTSGNTIPIDLTNDSYEFLITDKITSSEATATDIELSFKHAMSLLRITFTPTVEYSVLNSVEVKDVNTEWEYSFATSAFTTTSSETTQDIEFKIADGDDDTKIAEVILPAYNASLSLSFDFTSNTSTATKTKALAVNLQSGYIHPYTLTVGLDEPVLTAGNIDAWNGSVSYAENSTSTGKYVGDGSEAYPWAIYTQEEFASIGTTGHKFKLSHHYILMNDIEFSGSWTPIGINTASFSGSFNGGGYEISNLSVSGVTEAGLFGVSTGKIYNLGVASGSVSGTSIIGGLVAYNNGGSVINCYNMSSVSYSSYVGGVVGFNNNSGSVINCYNMGSVTNGSGSNNIGGVVGFNNATITNCYWASDAAGTGATAGVGGTSDDTTTALTTAQMSRARFADWMENSAVGVTGACAWKYDETKGRSVLDYGTDPSTTAADITYSGSTYQILTGYGLRAFADMVNGAGENTHMAIVGDDANFTFSTSDPSISGELSNDVDLSEVCGADFENWSPIGYALYNNGSTQVKVQYAGTFNGNNHTISNIYINDTSWYYEGTALFGYTNGAKIHNLHVDGEIALGHTAGGIVGYANSTTIINAHSDVNIYGPYAGGICGRTSSANIYNCYNTGTVNEYSGECGGIVGLGYNGSINTCYNLGETINGSSDIIGNYSNGSVSLTSTYWVEYSVSDATTGAKTEAEMKDATFLTLLNNGAYALNNNGGALSENAVKAYAWAADAEDSFPTFDTENDPEYTQPDIALVNSIYEIYSAKGLKAFADLVNGKANTSGATFDGFTFTELIQRDIDAILMDDINLSTICSASGDSWIPIAYDSNNSSIYSGEFNGNGYTISNLYIDTSYSNYPVEGSTSYRAVGLFGYVDDAAFNNLTVSGTIISSSKYYVGGIVGCCGLIPANTNNTTATSTITNCHSRITITSTATGSFYYAGGVAGLVCRTTITNCSYDGTLSGPYATGGITGATSDGSVIQNSYSNGSISGSYYAGGIVGFVRADYNSTLNNCYSSAAVTGSGDLGGVIGYIPSMSNGTVSISYCYWASNAANTAATSGIGSNLSGVEYTTTAMTLAEMRQSAFVAKLNAGAYYISGAYGWSPSDEYPVLDATVEPVVTAGVFDIVLSSSTYNIYSEAGLRAFANLVNGEDDDAGAFYESGNITFSDIPQNTISGVLQNNITLTSEWTPIANVTSNTNAYEGTFDGNSKTIKGLSITSATADCQGLFGYITTTNAEIKDLTVYGDITVTTVDHVGGIVGKAYSSSKITSCVSYVNVSGKSYVGGVVGYAYNANLTECGSNGTVKGANDIDGYTGGVAGYADTTIFTDCYNKGSVEGTGTVGGIVGYLSGITNLFSVYNRGGVTNNANSSSYTGGIVGRIYLDTSISVTITNSYNVGSISGGYYKGGLFGAFTTSSGGSLSLKDCYYLSDLFMNGDTITANMTTSNVSELSDTNMQGENFLTKINTNLSSNTSNNMSGGYELINSAGYPVLSWEVTTD